MNTGAAGNLGTCPASAPTAGATCATADTTVCNYPESSCACRLQGAVNVWTCVTCPALEPMNNSACTPPQGTTGGGVVCPYGRDFCACMSSGNWYCRCMGCP